MGHRHKLYKAVRSAVPSHKHKEQLVFEIVSADFVWEIGVWFHQYPSKGPVDSLWTRVGSHGSPHRSVRSQVVDCIWNAVVGTRKNEIRFLDAGGLFALLDCLEVAPMILKRQIIGCLADLMDSRAGEDECLRFWLCGGSCPKIGCILALVPFSLGFSNSLLFFFR